MKQLTLFQLPSASKDLVPLIPGYVGHKIDSRYARFHPAIAPDVWVEPFAGAGGHLQRWLQTSINAASLRAIVVADRDPTVRAIWKIWRNPRLHQSALDLERKIKQEVLQPFADAVDAIAQAALESCSWITRNNLAICLWRFSITWQLVRWCKCSSCEARNLRLLPYKPAIHSFFKAITGCFDRILAGKDRSLLWSFAISRIVRQTCHGGYARTNRQGCLNVSIDLIKLCVYLSRDPQLPPAPPCPVFVYSNWRQACDRAARFAAQSMRIFASVDPPYTMPNDPEIARDRKGSNGGLLNASYVAHEPYGLKQRLLATVPALRLQSLGAETVLFNYFDDRMFVALGARLRSTIELGSLERLLVGKKKSKVQAIECAYLLEKSSQVTSERDREAI